MAMTNASSATMIVVRQLLKRGNYKSWSIFMEDYLISQELWDGIIVPSSANQPLPGESERRKRNAAALNAIKISCGPESFIRIKYTRSAKDALDMLAEVHKTEPETDESTPKASNPLPWVASTIVPELLERGNYERWSIFMKNYLVSQDLWVVTHHSSTPLGVSKKGWRKKNAAALHAIQISCGVEKFNQIKKMRWAIEAWYELKTINNEEEKSKINNSEHEKEEEEEEEETPKINSASMIVPELLASDNYKRWSICMKSYLVSQDLWDAVLHSWAPVGVDKKEWSKKDAAALHAIQISCGPKIFDVIEEITSGKIAWDTLKHKRNSPSSDDFIDLREKQGFRTMERPRSLIVQNAIDKGDVNAVMDFLKRNPGAEELALWTGYPPLHHATIVGKSNIVKPLLENMPAVQKDRWDNTALACAAQFGNTESAKYLVSKDSSLLSMVNEDEDIPVVTVCRQGHKEMTNFLYSETPFEMLLCENGKQGSKLLRWCFTSKRFDIMFDIRPNTNSIQQWKWANILATMDLCVKKKKFEEIPLSGRLWILASFLLPFLGIKQIHTLKLSHCFARVSLHLICQHLTKLPLRKFEDTIALRKAVTSAIENGIYDFLIEIIETNADVLLAPVLDYETTSANFLMDAIAFRQEKIARFLIGLPLGNVFINAPDSSRANNILHVTGKLASDSQLSHISGAALQMQREIQWFKDGVRLDKINGKGMDWMGKD
ncbi:hypothetical protein SLEP1_g35282 [Rubroshorea leprosula]|uniref:DUF4219 domain-containing protein n=1 Tax=Rubroshorea leprosula TaxID=152421 RepID=A0AAV5KMU2_9ROSI|nr:hypothetical protein SLEP1_g35282 [Rubroshorea leprosula]